MVKREERRKTQHCIRSQTHALPGIVAVIPAYCRLKLEDRYELTAILSYIVIPGKPQKLHSETLSQKICIGICFCFLRQSVSV